jgi:magnesium-transporting ATPase (P-type)
LERDGMDVSREELQRVLSTTITDSDWGFWRINLTITPGSLADRLENSLLTQLKQKGAISESAMTSMTAPSFMTHFAYFLKYPRFIVIYSLFTASFYIAVILFLSHYYGLEEIYRAQYGYSCFGDAPLYLDEDFVPLELLFFQLAYFVAVVMLRRKPVAALRAFRFNNLIFCFLVFAVHLYASLLPNTGFRQFRSVSETAFFILTMLVSALLPIILSYRYVRRFPQAYNAIIASGVSPIYYDLRRVRDAYLMIAGYQRYVENADEDGWE